MQSAGLPRAVTSQVPKFSAPFGVLCGIAAVSQNALHHANPVCLFPADPSPIHWGFHAIGAGTRWADPGRGVSLSRNARALGGR